MSRIHAVQRLGAAVAAAVLLAALPASAAELVTAELEGAANEVTVEQGKTQNFNISLSATGSVACGSTHAAKVHTSYSVSAAGAMSSATLSDSVNFTGPSGSGNCPITWSGAPTPQTVAATVSAAATTPVGTYTTSLKEANGNTITSSSNDKGAKLEDGTATTLTVRVVAPAVVAPPASGGGGGGEPTDTAAPTGASISVNDGSAWTNSANGNVAVDLSGADAVGVASYRLAESQSGLDSATDVSVTPATTSFSLTDVSFTLTGAQGTAKSVWLRVCDAAGLCADASDAIGWDHTAPSVAYTSASPTANGAGWHKADVTATFTATDTLSGFSGGGMGTTGTVTTTGEGTEVTVASPAFTDVAGNTAAAGAVASVSFKIDKTDPTNVRFVDGPAEGASYYFGSVPAAPTCTADDVLSGFASCVVSGHATTVGPHTLKAEAKDVAGNVTTLTRSYAVLAWTIKGFYAPVDMGGVINTVKGGSTVPLKFEVFAGATELTDTSVVKPVVSKVSCTSGSTAPVEELAPTGGTSLRYDTTGGQFIFNWQTPKQANTCWSVTVTTADGTSSPPALFQLK